VPSAHAAESQRCTIDRVSFHNAGAVGWWTWRPRWFVFHSKGISYYKDEKEYRSGKPERGYLHLDHNLIVE
jgi:hypothetical protein